MPRVTHGQTKSPLYHTWKAMQRRCNSPKDPNYKSYGGRGIAVCERWSGANGIANFASDMGPRPSPRHSIDRRDNDGPYSPENCHWATRDQQSQNTRDAVLCAAAVMLMRHMVRRGAKTRDLTHAFGVLPGRVHAVVSGRQWKAVEL